MVPKSRPLRDKYYSFILKTMITDPKGKMEVTVCPGPHPRNNFSLTNCGGKAFFDIIIEASRYMVMEMQTQGVELGHRRDFHITWR